MGLVEKRTYKLECDHCYTSYCSPLERVAYRGLFLARIHEEGWRVRVLEQPTEGFCRTDEIWLCPECSKLSNEEIVAAATNGLNVEQNQRDISSK